MMNERKLVNDRLTYDEWSHGHRLLHRTCNTGENKDQRKIRTFLNKEFDDGII